jgi:hypothetical protein
MPASGDLQGTTAPLSLPVTTPIRIVIDQVIK